MSEVQLKMEMKEIFVVSAIGFLKIIILPPAVGGGGGGGGDIYSGHVPPLIKGHKIFF